MNKRGLSNIVATVLIILLAIAAVAIVWTFIQPTLRQSGTAVDLQQKCLQAEVRPVSCTIVPENGEATVNVQLVNSAGGSVSNIVAIVKDRNGATFVKDVLSQPGGRLPNELATATIKVSGFVGANSPFVAKAAARVKDSTTEITCGESIVALTCSIS